MVQKLQRVQTGKKYLKIILYDYKKYLKIIFE